MKQKAYKNLLVQYQGGGYDGCIWEWNYFLFDAEGVFHVVAASGYRGVTTETEARELLSRKPERFDPVHIYRLNVKRDLHSFQSECAPDHVAGVVAKVNHIYGRDIMYWECQDCECKVYDGEMFHDGYHGNGGIGIVNTGMLCMDCYSRGCCSYCGEYYGPDELKYIESRGEDLCEYCFEKRAVAVAE